MQTVLFSIRDRASVTSALAAIADLLKAPAIHPLYPDSPNPARQTEFFAALDDKSDVEDFARQLRELPDITNIEVPAPRKLIE